MNRIYSILLLTVYLFSTTELIQLIKIPLLIEHFREHKLEDQSFSVWDFLYIHYVKDQIHDQDYEKDMNLPFKTSSSFNFNFAIELLTQEFEESKIRILFSEKKKLKVFYILLLKSSYLSSIWQPPKMA